MIWKIIDRVVDFMSNPYVVVILTIITDVYMVMEMDGGIHSLGDVVFYTIIMPLILMMFYKGLPYVIATIIGLVILPVIIIKCIFKS